MAVANLNKIDEKLSSMYQNQVTTNVQQNSTYVDRSDILLAQMNFIATANRQALHLE